MKQPDAGTVRMAYRVVPSLHDVLPLIDTFLREGLPGSASPIE
jgi:hypothetical protein